MVVYLFLSVSDIPYIPLVATMYNGTPTANLRIYKIFPDALHRLLNDKIYITEHSGLLI
jgi:hypothetical protein